MRFNGGEEMADEMAAPNSAPTSLLTPVWRILDSLLTNVQNRFDLLRTEAREAEIRFVEIFLLCSAIVAFGTLAVSLETFVLVVLAWKEGSLVADHFVDCGLRVRPCVGRQCAEEALERSAALFRKLPKN